MSCLGQDSIPLPPAYSLFTTHMLSACTELFKDDLVLCLHISIIFIKIHNNLRRTKHTPQFRVVTMVFFSNYTIGFSIRVHESYVNLAARFCKQVCQILAYVLTESHGKFMLKYLCICNNAECSHKQLIVISIIHLGP